MNAGMQDWLMAVERMLPRSLLGRSILIIVTPIVLLQVISAWVFYDSHWNTVTKRLAQSVAGEIGAVTRLMPRAGTAPSDSEVAINALFETARDDLELALDFKPGEILPNDPTIMRQNLVDRQLAKALEDRVQRPFIIDSRSLEKYIEIHVQLADGVLHVVVLRRRLFSSTTYVFLLWMVGTSLALLAVATLFMRNQVKPIKRLAQAADDFGKGREVADFRAEGATEVALAGQAFNQMRNRIRRQIVQRTEMLAGVSHDLRTRRRHGTHDRRLSRLRAGRGHGTAGHHRPHRAGGRRGGRCAPPGRHHRPHFARAERGGAAAPRRLPPRPRQCHRQCPSLCRRHRRDTRAAAAPCRGDGRR